MKKKIQSRKSETTASYMVEGKKDGMWWVLNSLPDYEWRDAKSEMFKARDRREKEGGYENLRVRKVETTTETIVYSTTLKKSQ